MPRPYRLQHFRMNVHRLPVNLLEPGTNLVKVENRTFVKWIDDEFTAIVDRLNQKMGGEWNPVKLQAEPPPHLDIEHRERDRYSQAALQHLVKEGIARVTILITIPLEPLAGEEKFRQALNFFDGALSRAQSWFRLARQ